MQLHLSFGNKAYVFKRAGTTWEQSSVLVNASPVSNDRFGWDIAYDGLNIVVSANGYGQSNNDASDGSVFIFKQTNTQYDTNGLLAIENHTTHELYIDGEKKRLTADYNYK